MSNPVFPTLAKKPDSSQHVVEREDPALATEMEGGYVVTRARHTRTPRRTWTIGYSELRDADKQLLDNFWDTVRGPSVVFDWTDPESAMNGGAAKTYQVRFLPGAALKWSYKGVGPLKVWYVTFQLQQA